MVLFQEENVFYKRKQRLQKREKKGDEACLECAIQDTTLSLAFADRLPSVAGSDSNRYKVEKNSGKTGEDTNIKQTS